MAHWADCEKTIASADNKVRKVEVKVIKQGTAKDYLWPVSDIFYFFLRKTKRWTCLNIVDMSGLTVVTPDRECAGNSYHLQNLGGVCGFWF